MQMIKQGAVKDVPDQLAEFMRTRGWKPVAAPAAPEISAEEPDEQVEPPVEEQDDTDPAVVNGPPPAHGFWGKQRTTDPAEEQS